MPRRFRTGYGVGTRYDRDDQAAVDAGDMREPISLVRGSLVPDTSTDTSVTFIQHLTRYWNGMAKKREAEQSNFEGQNVDYVKWSHAWKTRWDGQMSIGLNDFVVWRDRLYTIVSVQPVARNDRFIWIKTMQVGRVAVNSTTVVRDNDTAPTQEAGGVVDSAFFTDKP